MAQLAEAVHAQEAPVATPERVGAGDLVLPWVAGEPSHLAQVLRLAGALDEVQEDPAGGEGAKVVGVATPEQRAVGDVAQAQLKVPPVGMGDA